MQKLLIVFALTTSLATAQSLLLVGPVATYPDVGAALAAATPGDVIEIAAGTYPAFQCAIGVTIRAAVPGTVLINLDGGVFAPNGFPMQFTAPAGQSVRVVGLRFGMPSSSLVAMSMPVVTFACPNALEDCEFDNFGGNSGNGRGLLRIPNGAFAHWQNVRVAGPGVFVEGKLTAVQCDLRGGASFGITNDALVVAGTLLASNCSFLGGFSSTQTSGAGIRVGAAARVWLSDCSIDRGAGFGAVCPLENLGGLVDLTRCTSVTPGCLPTGSGAGLGVQRSGPVTQGASFSISYHTTPGSPIGLLASFELADVVVPGLVQPAAAPLTATLNAGFGFADTQGVLTFSFTIPASPSFRGLPLWLHGLGGVSFPLQVAPPVGGLVR